MCTVLAKVVVHARKAISRIYTTKAQINSVSLQMKQQLGAYNLSVALVHAQTLFPRCYSETSCAIRSDVMTN